jgi:hypothetical protein
MSYRLLHRERLETAAPAQVQLTRPPRFPGLFVFIVLALGPIPPLILAPRIGNSLPVAIGYLIGTVALVVAALSLWLRSVGRWRAANAYSCGILEAEVQRIAEQARVTVKEVTILPTDQLYVSVKGQRVEVGVRLLQLLDPRELRVAVAHGLGSHRATPASLLIFIVGMIVLSTLSFLAVSLLSLPGFISGAVVGVIRICRAPSFVICGSGDGRT